jgi:hypothetical protein
VFFQRSLRSIGFSFGNLPHDPKGVQSIYPSSTQLLDKLVPSCPALNTFVLNLLPPKRPTLEPGIRSFFLYSAFLPLRAIKLPGQLDLGWDILSLVLRMPRLEELELDFSGGAALLPSAAHHSHETVLFPGIRVLKVRCKVSLLLSHFTSSSVL